MKMDLAGPLLSSGEAEIGKLLDRLAEDLLKRLQRSVPGARKGNPRAVRAFVRDWRGLEQRLLEECAREAPDLVVRAKEGYLVADVQGHPSALLTEILDQEALHAPFSPWVQARGDGEGVGFHCVASLRRLVGGAPLLPPGDLVAFRIGGARERGLDPSRFLRIAYEELRSDMPALESVSDTFALSDTDLARIFGVSRQRIAQWRAEGVPVSHRTKLNVLGRLAEVLGHNLLAERIPGIVRERAPALGGKSMLEILADDRHDELVARVEDSFDWAILG